MTAAAGYIEPGRAEVARAVPGASARVRGPRLERQFLDALGRWPALLALRSDAQRNVLEVGKWLARHASWADGTTRPTRERICRLAAVALSTWKAARRRLEAWGFLGCVQEGTTEQFRPMALANRSGPNAAAVYVLCIPRAASGPRAVAAVTSAASASPVTRPPTRTPDQLESPARTRTAVETPGTPKGRGFAAAALPAMARVMRHAAGQTITDGWCAWIGRRFAAAGWSAADVAWAIDHDPGGAQHRLGAPVRHPVGWLRWRLGRWCDEHGVMPSLTQQRAVSRHQARAAARRTRLDRAAEAAVPPADAIAAARRARLLGLDRPAAARPVVRWIEYGTRGDQRDRAGGRPRQGRVYQDGPVPGTIWVEAEGTGRLYELVHWHPDAPEDNYALATEQQ